MITTPPASVRKPLARWAGIVRLEGQTDLHDTKAQQDHTDRPDQAENKLRQVVDNRERVPGGKGRGSAAAKHEHHRCVNDKNAPALFAHGQAVGFLVLLGLLPKFGALAQIIPSPVLGGAMLVMFGFVSIQGMQILARVDFEHNEHNFLIAAVSIAAGVGLNNSTLFNGLPTGFQMFFANGIVVASVLAIVLNAILNRNKH